MAPAREGDSCHGDPVTGDGKTGCVDAAAMRGTAENTSNQTNELRQRQQRRRSSDVPVVDSPSVCPEAVLTCGNAERVSHWTECTGWLSLILLWILLLSIALLVARRVAFMFS